MSWRVGVCVFVCAFVYICVCAGRSPSIKKIITCRIICWRWIIIWALKRVQTLNLAAFKIQQKSQLKSWKSSCILRPFCPYDIKCTMWYLHWIWLFILVHRCSHFFTISNRLLIHIFFHRLFLNRTSLYVGKMCSQELYKDLSSRINNTPKFFCSLILWEKKYCRKIN